MGDSRDRFVDYFIRLLETNESLAGFVHHFGWYLPGKNEKIHGQTVSFRESIYQSED